MISRSAAGRTERAVANDRDECEIGDPQGKIGLGALLQIGGGVFILGDLGARNIALPGAVAGAIDDGAGAQIVGGRRSASDRNSFDLALMPGTRMREATP